MNVNKVREDLLNYSVESILKLAKHHGLDVNVGVHDLIDSIAEANVCMRANMNGASQILSQPPVFEELVKGLSYRDLKNLCRVDKQMRSICDEKNIWTAWVENAPYMEKVYALRDASKGNDVEFVELLVENGAAIDNTAVFNAWDTENVEIFDYLLENLRPGQFTVLFDDVSLGDELELVQHLTEHVLETFEEKRAQFILMIAHSRARGVIRDYLGYVLDEL